MLQTIHIGLAMQGGPHWALSDEEAKDFGRKLSNLSRHFPIVVSQKTIDIAAFATAVYTYEGARIRQSMALRRGGPPKPTGPAQIFQFAQASERQGLKGKGSEPPSPTQAPASPPAPSPGEPAMSYEPDFSDGPADA